jgi:hypothetical protein
MEGPVRNQSQGVGSQRQAKSYNLRDFNVSLYKVCRLQTQLQNRIPDSTLRTGLNYVLLCDTTFEPRLHAIHTLCKQHTHTRPEDQDLQRIA